MNDPQTHAYLEQIGRACLWVRDCAFIVVVLLGLILWRVW